MTSLSVITHFLHASQNTNLSKCRCHTINCTIVTPLQKNSCFCPAMMTSCWGEETRNLRRSVIHEELGAEKLLLCAEKSQMRWLRDPVRMPTGRLSGEVFHTRPSGRRPSGKPRTRWRVYVFWLSWEHLGIPLEELDEVTGKHGTPCLGRCPRDPNSCNRLRMDKLINEIAVWMDG